MKALMNEIQEINQKLSTIQYPDTPSKLYQPISYILGIGGKRVRSAMLSKLAGLYKVNTEHTSSAALAIEVFHNFTLVHDDIMDDAPLRRGNATVHEKWDTNVGILSGDGMLIEAYKHWAKLPAHLLANILPRFNTVAMEVCEGQQWDMDFEEKTEVSSESYLEMIRLKTAVLLGFSLECAGLLKEDKNLAELLYKIGETMGLAFQIKDDLLDTFPQGNDFGKQVGGDILSAKKTLLYIETMQLANEEQKSFMNQCYAKDSRDTKDVEAVKELMLNLSVDKKVLETATGYHQKSLELIHALENEKAKTFLLNFAEELLDRVN